MDLRYPVGVLAVCFVVGLIVSDGDIGFAAFVALVFPAFFVVIGLLAMMADGIGTRRKS